MTNKEAIERLEYIKTHHTDPEDYELFDLAIKALEERPQGEWIRDKVAFYLECSECGCDIRDANTCFLTDEDALNFCPNCGAEECD